MEASRMRKGTGWAAFAGTMILIVGTFNLIWGIVALVEGLVIYALTVYGDALRET
jgi:hypothetical protein